MQKILDSNDMDILEIGYTVAEIALDIFTYCNAFEDFCIQYIGSVAVFGGSNRVIFHPVNGWSLDAKYCNKQFIEKFQKWKEQWE